jgi:hypothetical protein
MPGRLGFNLFLSVYGSSFLFLLRYDKINPSGAIITGLFMERHKLHSPVSGYNYTIFVATIFATFLHMVGSSVGKSKW